MRQVNNEILKNPNYVTKSKITRAKLNSMCIPKFVSIAEAKDAFDSCFGEIIPTGNPYNENFQRHTKIVSTFELYNEIVKGKSSQKRKEIQRRRFY